MVLSSIPGSCHARPRRASWRRISQALTSEEAVAKAKTESRRYAKRQMTRRRFMSDWDCSSMPDTAVEAVVATRHDCVPISTTRSVGKLEVARRVVGVLRKEDEQPVLPQRHVRARRSHRASRQEERRGHDVKGPALFPGNGERLRHVRRFHEAEAEHRTRMKLSPSGSICTRSWRRPAARSR